MKSQRSFIDYSLDKRATLIALFRGTVDACDADPYLMRAAKWHGDKVDRNCPVCKKEELVELRYTFGEQLGQYSGRIKTPRELVEMERQFGEIHEELPLRLGSREILLVEHDSFATLLVRTLGEPIRYLAEFLDLSSFDGNRVCHYNRMIKSNGRLRPLEAGGRCRTR